MRTRAASRFIPLLLVLAVSGVGVAAFPGSSGALPIPPTISNGDPDAPTSGGSSSQKDDQSSGSRSGNSGSGGATKSSPTVTTSSTSTYSSPARMWTWNDRLGLTVRFLWSALYR